MIYDVKTLNGLEIDSDELNNGDESDAACIERLRAALQSSDERVYHLRAYRVMDSVCSACGNECGDIGCNCFDCDCSNCKRLLCG